MFFRWRFRDVLAGSQLERAAAWRHNVEQRPVLHAYLVRWASLMVAGVALGESFQDNHGVNLCTAVGYAVAAGSMQICVVICILIFKLRGHYRDYE